MKIAVISLGSVSSKMIAEELGNYFSEVDLLDIRRIEVSVGLGAKGVLYDGEVMHDYDCVFVRGSYKYAAIQTAITSMLYDSCYMPYPTEVFMKVHDKLLTHLALEVSKTPMPKTYLASTVKGAKELLGTVTYPIIIKIPQGTQGKGVMFADSFAAASSMLDALTTLKQPFLIQEFLDTGGVDVRAFVVGDKVVACMKRKASGEDMRSNIHAGGSAESYIPDSKLKKIAVNTAKALGSEICGVDILEGMKGPQVIEANLSPGLQGITASTGINVAGYIAKYLFEKTTEFKENKKKERNVNSILEEEGIDNALTKNAEAVNLTSNVVSRLSANLIDSITYRGERILLPKNVCLKAQFEEGSECFFEFDKHHIVIKKM